MPSKKCKKRLSHSNNPPTGKIPLYHSTWCELYQQQCLFLPLVRLLSLQTTDRNWELPRVLVLFGKGSDTAEECVQSAQLHMLIKLKYLLENWQHKTTRMWKTNKLYHLYRGYTSFELVILLVSPLGLKHWADKEKTHSEPGQRRDKIRWESFPLVSENGRRLDSNRLAHWLGSKFSPVNLSARNTHFGKAEPDAIFARGTVLLVAAHFTGSQVIFSPMIQFIWIPRLPPLPAAKAQQHEAWWGIVNVFSFWITPMRNKERKYICEKKKDKLAK